jgi:histidine triad (HIT) family protein
MVEDDEHGQQGQGRGGRGKADCVFCGIMEGRLPASVAYEDHIVVAFMDIRPVNPGHLLVVPRRHFPHLSDMDEYTGVHLFRIALRLQDAVRRSGVRCEGINLFVADGEAAGQEILHVHVHIIPRYKGDGFKIEANWSERPPYEELDAIAARIREAYSGC